jgi:Uma2 family endonuclease
MPPLTGLSHEWTVADLLARFGPIAHRRVRQDPAPGTATEQDVVQIFEREKRLYELIDGVLLEKPMGTQESFLAGFLVHTLFGFVKARDLGFVLPPDGMARLFPGMVRIPDVSFVSWSQVPGRKVPRVPMLDFAPVLAVEVLSPSNTHEEMDEKRRDYFKAGTRTVWYVDAAKRTVQVFNASTQTITLRDDDTLLGDPVLPGFVLSLRELFASLED